MASRRSPPPSAVVGDDAANARAGCETEPSVTLQPEPEPRTIRLRVVVATQGAAATASGGGRADDAPRAAPGGKVEEGTAQLWLAYDDCCLLGEVARNCCVNAGMDPDTHSMSVEGVHARCLADTAIHSTTLQQAGVASGATVTLVPRANKTTLAT